MYHEQIKREPIECCFELLAVIWILISWSNQPRHRNDFNANYFPYNNEYLSKEHMFRVIEALNKNSQVEYYHYLLRTAFNMFQKRDQNYSIKQKYELILRQTTAKWSPTNMYHQFYALEQKHLLKVHHVLDSEKRSFLSTTTWKGGNKNSRSA